MQIIKQMRPLLLFVALIFSSALMAQNTEKINNTKHVQTQNPLNPKGILLWENFEDLLMPPNDWQLIQGPTPATWETFTFDPAWGQAYVHCLYDESLSGIQDEYLITKVMDLRTFSNVTLTFLFQFSKYWGIKPHDNYDLLVLASIDSAKTFTDTLWTELSTDTSSWNSFEWVFATVDLSSYIGQEKFALAFVYYGFDGAEAAIDVVSVETVGGMDEKNILQKVYPNHAENYIKLETKEQGNLVIYDLQGRAVLKTGITGNETIDISGLNAGRYNMTFYNKNTVQNEPLLIVR